MICLPNAVNEFIGMKFLIRKAVMSVGIPKSIIARLHARFVIQNNIIKLALLQGSIKLYILYISPSNARQISIIEQCLLHDNISIQLHRKPSFPINLLVLLLNFQG